MLLSRLIYRPPFEFVLWGGPRPASSFCNRRGRFFLSPRSSTTNFLANHGQKLGSMYSSRNSKRSPGGITPRTSASTRRLAAIFDFLPISSWDGTIIAVLVPPTLTFARVAFSAMHIVCKYFRKGIYTVRDLQLYNEITHVSKNDTKLHRCEKLWAD